MMAMQADALQVDQGTSEAVASGLIDFTVPDVRNITSEEFIYSPCVRVYNISWRIAVRKRLGEIPQSIPMFGFFLDSSPDLAFARKTWSCSVVAQYILVPFKPDVAVMKSRITHRYHEKSRKWGKRFLRFDHVVDATRGFANPANHSLRLQIQFTISTATDLWERGFLVAKPTDMSNRLLHEDFSQLYESKTLSDFVLVSSDAREFPVHRAILAARSKVFSTMLTTETSKECQTGRCEITDLDGETVEALVKFMYGCYEVNALVPLEPEKLLGAADKYDFCALVTICCNALCRQVKGWNAGDMLVLAERYNLAPLKQAVFKCVKVRMRSFLKSDQLEVVRDYGGTLLDELLEEVTPPES